MECAECGDDRIETEVDEEGICHFKCLACGNSWDNDNL